MFAPPETVTIPGEAALEALALLGAYADALADLSVDGEPDPFFNLNDAAWVPLADALGYDRTRDLDDQPWSAAADDRGHALEEAVRAQLSAPALAAIETTRLAHELAELKLRMGLVV